MLPAWCEYRFDDVSYLSPCVCMQTVDRPEFLTPCLLARNRLAWDWIRLDSPWKLHSWELKLGRSPIRQWLNALRLV